MTETPEDIKALQEKVRKVQAQHDAEENRSPTGPTVKDYQGMSMAFRIGIELVAALFVGVFLGKLFDDYAGFHPWGKIIGFFIGIGAGFTNIYRLTSGQTPQKRYKDAKDMDTPENNED